MVRSSAALTREKTGLLSVIKPVSVWRRDACRDCLTKVVRLFLYMLVRRVPGRAAGLWHRAARASAGQHTGRGKVQKDPDAPGYVGQQVPGALD